MVVVAEQNLGQLAALLRIRINDFSPYQYNQVKGQPFVVSELVEAFETLITNPNDKAIGRTFDTKMLQ